MTEDQRESDADFEVAEYCGRLSCRKVIVQTPGRGRRKEFCSETCRRGADREYKRAKALVESFERNLRTFRHEVAAYGRKAEDDVITAEELVRVQREAQVAIGRAQGVVKFSAGVPNPYLDELRLLLQAVEPLVTPEVVRATA